MVTVDSKYRYACTCTSCKTDLAYNYDDVEMYTVTTDKYQLNYTVVKGIECPVCKTIVKVEVE